MKNTIFDGTQMISISDSIYITFVSMAIVFFVLILISLTISLLKYIPSEKENIKKNVIKSMKVDPPIESITFNPKDIKNDKMRVAIIVASIEASNEIENSYIKIKSVKELN